VGSKRVGTAVGCDEGWIDDSLDNGFVDDCEDGIEEGCWLAAAMAGINVTLFVDPNW
jgi:hypothetical protein